eukprot:RCo007680
MPVNHLSLELGLNNRNSLVHLPDELPLLRGEGLIRGRLGDKVLARVRLVGLLGKGDQGQHADSVALLEGLHVGVPQRHPDVVRNAHVRASRGTHPNDVVVSPLNIHRVVLAQGIQDDLCAWASVPNVPNDVQLGHGQALAQVGHGADKVFGLTHADNGADNRGDVLCPVVVVGRGRGVRRKLLQELLNGVGEGRRHGLANVGAGVLPAEHTAQHDNLAEQPPQQGLPVVGLLQQKRELLLWVVDQCTELLQFLLTHVLECFFGLVADHPRAVSQDMDECFVLPVHVGEEVLSAFWKVQDGVEVHNLRASRSQAGKRLRQQVCLIVFQLQDGGAVRGHRGERRKRRLLHTQVLLPHCGGKGGGGGKNVFSKK